MNNSLDKIRVIDRSLLNEEDYFQSLLSEALGKGIINDTDIERLQLECLNLLAEKTNRYNLGVSSSIRVENAQSIMASNMFTIGAALKHCPTPDDAVTTLQSQSINEIYKKGRKRIDLLLLKAKAIQNGLQKRLFPTKNEFYNLTINGAIEGFFKLYNPDFAAHEIHITDGYPAFNPVPRLAGVEFITEYIGALFYENQFCGYFSPESVHRLLSGYNGDYEHLLFNIYEPVLTSAIGCIITGADVYRLDIAKSGAKHLERLLAEMQGSEILKVLRQSAEELARCLECPPSLANYIRNSLPIIANRIETAAQARTLNSVFAVPVLPENAPDITFSFGVKMDNEKYRNVIEEIRQCRLLEDKLAIIKEFIRSLADLEDVLLDADFTAEEMQAVFSLLNMQELAAFLKKHPKQPYLDTADLREPEQFLRQNLHNFISKLPSNQQEIIANFLHRIV
ncbi:MAG: DUF6179 domain-containing protein [Clostridiales bacterium]|jgi:hypothetical protein|nr:DUF6179 domain-containing protein [Clostridiales bacterium]